MLDAFSFAATAGDCEVETQLRKSYRGYRFKRDDDVVSSRRRRSRACGYEPSYALSGGGADANVFNERGRRCANLANGMTDIHTPDERIAVADLDGDGRGDARARRRGTRRLMEERRLGPVVGLGTWNTFGADSVLAGRVVAAALDAGVRVFDSSPMYRGAEASLGAALDGRRSDATVATKIWSQSVEEGREQYRRQLEWFGRVDVEQIHNLAAWRGQLAWLEPERDEGRVSKLGVTHYAASAFGELAEALRTRRFDAVQLPYNPHEREVRARAPAARRGARRGRHRDAAARRGLARPPPAERLARSSPLRAFGVETWAQALLKWVLSDERVDVAIPATSRPGAAGRERAAGKPPWFGPEERALVERLAA